MAQKTEREKAQKIIAGEARITVLPSGGQLLGELLAAGDKPKHAPPPAPVKPTS